MTNAELKTRFNVGYEFLANNLAPGYTDAEISGLLNQGMDLLVDELYANGDMLGLAELLVSSTLNLATASFENYGSNAYETTTSLPSDYRWVVNVKVKSVRGTPFVVNTGFIPAEIIPKQEADYWMQTLANRPMIITPKVVLVNSASTIRFIVLVDMYTTVTTTGGFQVVYVKTPTRIDVSNSNVNELHPRWHQKIVDKAIALAMKAADAQRASAEIQINKAI